MPDDDQYLLTQVADYLLPVSVGTGADIAANSTLLWMPVDYQARCSICRGQGQS
jgi:hypothetical protein